MREDASTNYAAMRESETECLRREVRRLREENRKLRARLERQETNVRKFRKAS